MKRNLDLIREILIFIEDSNGPVNSSFEIEIPEITYEELCYHLKLMYQADMISYQNSTTFDHEQYSLIEMTYNGHEYLDKIRDVAIWSKVKEKLGSFVNSIGFDVIKSIAVKVAERMIGF